ncbi:hypothetical protein AURDEDRAFT_130283 [Auricularia subglabra TFB-10046 SS5]|nr:hypothetical protein AURDEDRAFT_130283 [Auricularia subglabra TFB-10046 SS5]
MPPGLYIAPDYSSSGQSNVVGGQTASAKARKAEREAKAAVLRGKTAELVKNFKGDLSSLAKDLDIPEQHVLQAGHVAFAKQSRGRRRSLYQAAIVVARQETPDALWSDVLNRASEINTRLKRVQECGDWNDPQLLECQAIQEKLQERADVAAVPKSHSKTQRAVQQEVTRTTDDVASKLATLNAAYGTEHVFALTRGNHESSLSTQLVTSNKADDFFSFRLDKQIEDVVADMEGYAVWGAEAGKNGKGKTIDFRGQISRAFGKQLGCEAELTGNDKVRIQWKNMDDFCEKHGLELAGWPPSLPFKKMANINRTDAKRVWALVKDGTCRFQRKELGSSTSPQRRSVGHNRSARVPGVSTASPSIPAASTGPIPGPSSFPIPVFSSPDYIIPHSTVAPLPGPSDEFQYGHVGSSAFSHDFSDEFDVLRTA